MFSILIIEDSPDDLFFFKRALNKSGLQTTLSVTSDAMEGLELIRTKKFDCIFSDYMLPSLNGLEVLTQIRSIDKNIPVIMLTGQQDAQTIVRLMKKGATDYISKGHLSPDTLRLSIENARKLFDIQSKRNEAEKALKTSESRLAEAQRIAYLGNWEYYIRAKRVHLSGEARSILGYIPDAPLPSFFKLIKQVHRDDIPIIKKCLQAIKGRRSYDVTFRIYVNGSLKFINAKGNILSENRESSYKVVGTIQDITLLKNALNDIEKAKISKKATSIVLAIAIGIFILSEAILDPFIDAMGTELLIALSCKGGIALFLKPIETFLEKFMLNRVT